ncbi:MAG TPA: prepilin peptidase, partial [Chthoniobacterales bacterium]|nr:prepilin peptidase [Chthoniobacterales bacterium]
YERVFEVVAFFLGACIGSFLNVCIYRLPLNLSVNQPRRSFCPSCKTQIPWHQNLPLVSWLLLRGRCARCGARIAFRYFAVELLTALFFLIIWKSFPWQIAIVYWVFIALVIVATFIDFEHFIIPDEITIGGTVAGLFASIAIPQLMNTNHRLMAALTSVASAALGYALLWLVLEGGKIVFGKKRIRLEKPTAFTWTRHGDDADFVVGDEKNLWSDFFARERDQLLLHCSSAKTSDRQFTDVILRFHYNRVQAGSETFELDQLDEISGIANEVEIPREAMGRGDLKFLACIGAFLGWRAVLFAIFAGSLYGSAVGLVTLILGKRVWSLKLPFGPYLALGAITWMFCGDSIVRWYQTLLQS